MIQIYKNPPKSSWNSLTQRPVVEDGQLTEAVESIFTSVKKNGDQAIKKFSSLFDGVDQAAIKISKERIAQAQVAPKLFEAMQKAAANIETFHRSQICAGKSVETSPGVSCWQKEVPIEKVGLYIPGGSAPLFSSVLMLGIPAKIAGCKKIVVCTPPQKNSQINPAILVACKLVGIDSVFAVGGVQAIAAMTFGTESIPQVYKILGPGNQYVTKAKEFATTLGVAIDMPAGPSELLVIADSSCVPAYVAADLLSQAEHGPDSQVILLSNSLGVIQKVNAAIKQQLQKLPRVEIAKQALINSKAILLDSIDSCLEWSNYYAPEHLIIATKNAKSVSEKVSNAGSVFLGNYSPESAGDYASGTNHTLPTNGFAKNYSGVSVASFTKKITFQQISKKGLQNLGPTIELLAKAEGLEAHKNAVSIRLKNLTNE